MERNGSNLLRSDRVCSVQDDAVLPMPGDFAVLNTHPCVFLYIKSRCSQCIPYAVLSVSGQIRAFKTECQIVLKRVFGSTLAGDIDRQQAVPTGVVEA